MMDSGGRVCGALSTISAHLLILTNGDKGDASAYTFNLNDNDFHLNIVLAKVPT